MKTRSGYVTTASGPKQRQLWVIVNDSFKTTNQSGRRATAGPVPVSPADHLRNLPRQLPDRAVVVFAGRVVLGLHGVAAVSLALISGHHLHATKNGYFYVLISISLLLSEDF
jgi:hypothetical protein